MLGVISFGAWATGIVTGDFAISATVHAGIGSVLVGINSDSGRFHGLEDSLRIDLSSFFQPPWF
jgi:hypothetical protein